MTRPITMSSLIHFTMSKAELLDELRNVDEVTLLELLEITSDDLVDKFSDEIEEHQVKLIKYFNDN